VGLCISCIWQHNNSVRFKFSRRRARRWLSSWLLRRVVWWIAVMMEATSTSETSVSFYQTIRCNNPEDSHLNNNSLIIHFLCIWWLLLRKGSCAMCDLGGLWTRVLLVQREAVERWGRGSNRAWDVWANEWGLPVVVSVYETGTSTQPVQLGDHNRVKTRS
jgi:hypothetical protein